MSNTQISDMAGASSRHFSSLAESLERLVPLAARFPVVAIGDIHSSSPKNLVTDLRRYGVIDITGCISPAFDGVACFMGDYVDRGAHGLEGYRLAKRLRTESPDNCRMLMGNHDLFHLLDCPHAIRAPAIPGFSAELREDILKGVVQLAWYESDTLYTHAGLHLGYFPEFKDKPLEVIVNELNARLVEFARKIIPGRPDLNLMLVEEEPLLGDHGVVWTRGRIENDQFRQVVGHTPQDRIKSDPGLRVKYVDAGRVFGEESIELDTRSHARMLGQNSVAFPHRAPRVRDTDT